MDGWTREKYTETETRTKTKTEAGTKAIYMKYTEKEGKGVRTRRREGRGVRRVAESPLVRGPRCAQGQPCRAQPPAGRVRRGDGEQPVALAHELLEPRPHSPESECGRGPGRNERGGGGREEKRRAREEEGRR